MQLDGRLAARTQPEAEEVSGIALGKPSRAKLPPSSWETDVGLDKDARQSGISGVSLWVGFFAGYGFFTVYGFFAVDGFFTGSRFPSWFTGLFTGTVSLRSLLFCCLLFGAVV